VELENKTTGHNRNIRALWVPETFLSKGRKDVTFQLSPLAGPNGEEGGMHGAIPLDNFIVPRILEAFKATPGANHELVGKIVLTEMEDLMPLLGIKAQRRGKSGMYDSHVYEMYEWRKRKFLAWLWDSPIPYNTPEAAWTEFQADAVI
jgi:hypothetical protein